MKNTIYHLLVIILLASGFKLSASNGESPTLSMEDTWQQFRQIHPYGFQTVALKHVGDECVFVISEPSEDVSESSLNHLFRKYGGCMIVKHQPLGYDGWLGDAVGSIRFKDKDDFDSFTRELFNLLYGTDYKHYYTDLDHPSEHVYFSEDRLNFSISAAEIYTWFIKDKEAFLVDDNKTKTINGILSSKSSQTNELYYSKDRGFVAWVITPDKITTSDKSFKINARRFALDSDLIIGAIGKKNGKMAIIARERVVPVTVLPPLRIETITLLATTDNDELAQSFELYDVFAGKTNENMDMAPIYLSDELKHTEYGNLLNMTDQMLKSWTENNDVHDYNYDYPVPIDWAFNDGVFHDLNLSHSLTYNWNTAGAGYVIKDWDGLDIYAVNRTGCLPVSFIPEGMEGKVNEKVNEAEELAYDFFSELNSPELVREVQYATLYQIFRYFTVPKQKELKTIEQWEKSLLFEINNIPLSVFNFPKNIDSMRNIDSIINSSYHQHNTHSFLKSQEEPDIYDLFQLDIINTKNTNGKASDSNSNNSFNSLYDNVENLLIISMYLDTPEHHDSCLAIGFNRYLERNTKRSALYQKSNLIENDPYGDFEAYLENNLSLWDLMWFIEPYTESIQFEYNSYLSASIDTICNYIRQYESHYGPFPYKEASKYIVDRNAWEREIKRLQKSYELHEQEYHAVVNEFNAKVNKFNSQQSRTFSDKFKLDYEREQVKKILKHIEEEFSKDIKEQNRVESLMPNTNQKRALGTLNWLLTDPNPYDAPIGPFYADKCTSHKQWMKSSPVTCSSISWAYGGHNLNSHISPINLASKAPKSGKAIKEGFCCVSMENGQKVITVAKADKAKVTPKVLRTIERKIVGTEKGEMFKLPQAPKERPKIAIIEKGSTNEARGFDKIKHSSNNMSKQVFVEGKEVKTSSELRKAIAYGVESTEANPVKTIQFKDYSARKVHVKSEGLGDCVIERSPSESINLNNFSDDIKIVRQNDGTITISLEQLPETLPDNGKWKSGTLKISCQGQDVKSAEEAIRTVRSLPKQQIDNAFKWKQKLNMKLQETNPGFNFNDIKCEFNLTGYIFFEFENETLFENAA